MGRHNQWQRDGYQLKPTDWDSTIKRICALSAEEREAIDRKVNFFSFLSNLSHEMGLLIVQSHLCNRPIECLNLYPSFSVNKILRAIE